LERANLGDALRGVSLSPFQRDFTSFGLDDALDLVKNVSGKTIEDSSADSLSGSRALKVSGDFSIEDLPEIAEEALEFYGSVNYQNSSFKIIDSVSAVTDTRLSAILDGLAIDSIRSGLDEFELGLPIRYDDDSVGYKFAGPRLQGRYPDLLLRNYTSALGPKLLDITIETLKDHKVVAVYEDARPDQKWSVRSALVGSLSHDGGRYAINEGEWYRVDEAFKNSIEEKFQDMIEEWEEPQVPFRKIYDASNNGQFQTEASYNAEMAHRTGYILMDKKLIGIPGVQRSRFEPCDLLDIEGKRFIHVKKSSRRSNILSHFFKQASNSAQQFSKFPAAWDELVKIVEDNNGTEIALNLISAIESKDRKWKILLIIADAPRQNRLFNIPFFSKISLRDESITLNAMGYEISLRFIGLEPEELRVNSN